MYWTEIIPVEEFILKVGEQVNMHKQAWMWWHELQQQHDTTKVGVQAPSLQSRAAEPQSSPSHLAAQCSVVTAASLQGVHALHPSTTQTKKKKESVLLLRLLECKLSFYTVYKFILPGVIRGDEL